jgi:PBP1b-binding outer membrane lipoprotein LpoB
MRPDERGFVAGTGVESQDIVGVTDKMARGLLALDAINTAKSPPYIVLEPVINETRFPINKDIFLTRMQTQLASKSGGKMRFLMRDRLAALLKERDAKRAGQFTSDSDPNIQEFKGADYILTGKLQSQTTKTSAGTSDYVLYTFQLIDARTTVLVWAGDHEIKKQGLEDATYR